MKRHYLIFRPMDQESRSSIVTATEMREGRDTGYEMGWRGLGPGGSWVNAIEEERETVSFFEEGEDEFGARVVWAEPA